MYIIRRRMEAITGMTAQELQDLINKASAQLVVNEAEALKVKREADKKSWVSEKRSKAEINTLLEELWELKNPEKVADKPKEKAKRSKKAPTPNFGQCPCRSWGNGFGQQCPQKATGEGLYCKRHNTEQEEYGGIALGLMSEERPTEWTKESLGKIGKIGKIGWKKEADTESSEEESLEA